MSYHDKPRPQPTSDHIALHARRRPNHIAVVSDTRRVSYALLDKQLTAMTAAIAQLGLPPGAVLAIAHPDVQIRLLILLACERLGLAAGEFRADEGRDADALLGVADIVLAAHDVAAGRCARLVRLTEAWLMAALSQQPSSSLPTPGPLDRVLVVRSSGSTGRPKAMRLTRAMLEARVARRVVSMGYRRGDRFLAIMHFTVAAVFYASLVCLRIGATVISYAGLTVAAALERYRPTQSYMLPFQLARLLADPAPLPMLPGLTIGMAGAKLPPGVRRQAATRLGARIVAFYGANETANISVLDDDEVGTPIPGTHVEIVDGRGMRLPPGEIGEIRISGTTVMDGYIGDPEATAATLRDGWYYTKDVGTMSADGRFKVLGRRDDVLNFGGIKRAAADIQAEIAALDPSKDVAVLAGHDAEGTLAVVCVVAEAEAEVARLADRITRSMLGRFAVYRVEVIPRTPEGKLKRAVLQQAVVGRLPVRRTDAQRREALAQPAAT